MRVEREDVVPLGKIASDLQWHCVDAYVGLTLRCRKCGADFSFSAAEQKAWREEYDFSIHSYDRRTGAENEGGAEENCLEGGGNRVGLNERRFHGSGIKGIKFDGSSVERAASLMTGPDKQPPE